MSVSDWKAGVGRDREARPVMANGTALDVLRQRFRDISTRTRAHRQSSWINRPGFTSLRNHSDAALELTRLAFHELSQFEQPGSPTISLKALSQLLMENQLRLAEIDRQLQQLQQLVAVAECLRGPLEALLDQGQSSFGAWKTLVGEVSALTGQNALDAASSDAGRLLDNCLATEAWPFAWFYAPAIHRTSWMLRMQPHFPELQLHAVDTLLIAALLADFGLLIQFPKSRAADAPPPSIHESNYHRHPEISAAVISQIEHSSPLSALLVGQHHERLDGAGYPRRLKGSGLCSLSRSFAIVVRWSELLLLSPPDDASADSVSHAAQTLSREAWQGAWDLQLVKRLVSAWELTARAVNSTGSEQSPATSSIDLSLDRREVNTESPSRLRRLDGPAPIAPPAMLGPRVSAFKEDGPLARPTPPPRPAVSGKR